MKRKDLDHAFDPTPHIFINRVDAVLQTIKEDEPVKKFTIRTVMVALLYTMLFCSIAFAIVLTQGQEWYYNNLFTAYQENNPEKQQAIFAHLETDIQQEPSKDSNGLVEVTVQDYAWVPSQNLFTLSLAARVKDSGTYELHPKMDMDPDGYWAPTLDPKVKESRTEHWLSTEQGFGLPADVMNDPNKTLLLADMGSHHILIGDSNVELIPYSFDSFTGDDGAVIAVMEIDLKQSDFTSHLEDTDAAVSSPSADYISLRLGDSGGTVAKLQEALAAQGYYHGGIDGLYGEGMRTAVMAFQKAHELVDDGVAGPATQSKIYEAKETSEIGSASVDDVTLHLGDTGNDVRNLQHRLMELGYYLGKIDGMYSEDVSAAVMAFQEANKFFNDGVAGPHTQDKLYSYYAEQAPKNSGIAYEAEKADILGARLEQEYENMKAKQEDPFLSSAHADAVNSAIEQYTDAEGMLSLRLPYQIIPFENGKYGSPSVGMAVFKVKIR